MGRHFHINILITRVANVSLKSDFMMSAEY